MLQKTQNIIHKKDIKFFTNLGYVHRYLKTINGSLYLRSNRMQWNHWHQFLSFKNQ